MSGIITQRINQIIPGGTGSALFVDKLNELSKTIQKAAGVTTNEWTIILRLLVDSGEIDLGFLNEKYPTKQTLLTQYYEWIAGTRDTKTFSENLRLASTGANKAKKAVYNWIFYELGDASGRSYLNELGSILTTVRNHLRVILHNTSEEKFANEYTWASDYRRNKYLKDYVNKKDKLISKDSFKVDAKTLTKRMKDSFSKTNFIGTFAKIGTFIIMLLNKFKFTDISLLLGLLPLSHINMIEIAHSGKILKFRAVGSIFLAHQLGGLDTIKASGYFYGPNKYFEFFYVWMMFLLGQGRLSEIIDPSSLDMNQFKNKVADIIRYDKKLEKPSTEKHMTFPIVTKYEIVPNCYIETFDYGENVVDGKDAIKYDILMRTYTEPNRFVVLKNKDDDSLQTVGSQVSTNFQRSLYYGMNFMWREIQRINETGIPHLLDTESWKSEHGYNIDPLDLAATFGLGLAIPTLTSVLI